MPARKDPDLTIPLGTTRSDRAIQQRKAKRVNKDILNIARGMLREQERIKAEMKRKKDR